MTNNVRIKMEISTHVFEDSILDIMKVRFSKLIQDIFEELDDKSLTNSKIASKSWCDFIEDKKVSISQKMEEFKKL